MVLIGNFNIMKKTISNLIFNRKNKLIGEEKALLIKESFTFYMKKEIEHSTLRESTSKNHLSTLQLLVRYRENVMFEDLNFEFLCDFEEFLLKQNYNRNTISKHMKHLRRYLNLAVNKELYNPVRDPFRRYKMKYQESRRIHLTPEEIIRLESLDLHDIPHLRRTRDMFLFSCYTGLRFSDIVRLTDENFYLIDGKLWLIYYTQKTETDIRLPLFLLFNGKGLTIYNQYKEKGGVLFNVSVISNSNINKHLKKIASLAGISKKISYHVSRHTNATLLLYKGANITTVQKLLGHKNVQTTQIYGNIMDMTIVKDLERIR